LKKSVSPGGRPRAFDTDKALDQALLIFWKKGYEGATMADLTQAMGIVRPSLYAAFGNKAELFRRVIKRYASQYATVTDPVSQPTSRGVAERLLRCTADAMGDPDPNRPRGCLVVHGALASSDEASPIQKDLIALRTEHFVLLRKRFVKAKAEGDLPSDSDPAALARYLLALSYGMAVQAVNGANRAELHRLVDVALKAWPSPPKASGVTGS
jgi:AcrR family transcriptional regulator